MTSTMNDDCLQNILSFLTPEDARSLAKTNKFYRDGVVKNNCQVLTQGVDSLEYKKGTRWEEQVYVTTKEEALVLFEKYKQDPKIYFVKIYHYEAPLGWCANNPEWTIEWNRKDFFN